MNKESMLSALDGMLYSNKVIDEIKVNYFKEIQMCIMLQQLVDEYLLTDLNEIFEECSDDEDRLLVDTILLLMGQAIMTFKSSVLLAVNGYYTNSMMNIRTLYEVIFNIRFILFEDDPAVRTMRVRDYIQNVTQKVKKKTVTNTDKALYDTFYGTLSEFIHVRYSCTMQNFDGEKIITNPSANKIDLALVQAFSTFHHLVEYVGVRFGLTRFLILMDSIPKTDGFFLWKIFINDAVSEVISKTNKEKY